MTDLAPNTPAPAGRRILSAASGTWRAFDPVVRIAAIVLVALVLAALFAPLVAPFSPTEQSLLARLRPPLGFERAIPEHILGTDALGRDVLSRCLYGLRLTLFLALLGAAIGMLVGGTLGLISGLVGGRVDAFIMGAVDTQIAVPFTLIALLAVAVFGSELHVLIPVLGIAYWEQYARIVRGETLRLKAMPFVEAARAAGASPWRIARHHLPPNLASPVVVIFTINFANIVLLESTLSFLGLGVQPPTATLGAMVGQGRDYMPSAPWIVAAPALLILVVTLSVQLVGDWLRDRVDVRLQRRAP
jgi:peptide/nickel transport system permease protein